MVLSIICNGSTLHRTNIEYGTHGVYKGISVQFVMRIRFKYIMTCAIYFLKTEIAVLGWYTILVLLRVEPLKLMGVTNWFSMTQSLLFASKNVYSGSLGNYDITWAVFWNPEYSLLFTKRRDALMDLTKFCPFQRSLQESQQPASTWPVFTGIAESIFSPPLMNPFMLDPHTQWATNLEAAYQPDVVAHQEYTPNTLILMLSWNCLMETAYHPVSQNMQVLTGRLQD